MTLNGWNKTLLNGLVLAGGKSIRMGQHKDQMQWNGREQRYHVADLLKAFCGEVFISCRQDQVAGLDKAYKALPDTFLHMGPLGGILSALRMDREAAWLVVGLGGCSRCGEGLSASSSWFERRCLQVGASDNCCWPTHVRAFRFTCCCSCLKRTTLLLFLQVEMVAS